MFEPTRHFTPSFKRWSKAAALSAIEEIVTDAFSMLDASELWPAHPLDGEFDGRGSLYFGASGVVWALDYLLRVQGRSGTHDLASPLTIALIQNAPWLAATPYARHASLLMGDLGILLVQMRIAPDQGLADEIYVLAASNNDLPVVELMWGLPGSLLACLHMHTMTGDVRFQALFRIQATRLLAGLEMANNGLIWTQDLYGKRQRWLGPLHGFAGNMLPLLKGWQWLSPLQREVVTDAVPRTLASHVVPSRFGANWPAFVPNNKPPVLCQHCHGAPGMVTTFADAPFSTPEFEALLIRGGELTWNAGPLVKGSNLCHGTGGNGYALLKLYQRTADPLWLGRARSFAMAAIDQAREARAEFGHGRYSLWTGDVGLAVYLWDCVTGMPRFPTIDVL